MTQEIANTVKVANDTCSDGTVNLISEKTAWALLIKNKDYKVDGKMKSTHAFNNQIYDLPADMICVITWYWHHLEDPYWREQSLIDSKHIR